MIFSYESGNESAKPDLMAFNGVLNACAYTSLPDEKVEAFSILVSTLLLKQKYAQPHHSSYYTFLKACYKLLPKDESRKKRVIEAVFR